MLEGDHIETPAESVDTLAEGDDTEALPDTEQAPNPAAGVKTDPADKQDPSGEPAETEPHVPFKNGKEKFKFKDGEFEYDWATTKKYVELGRGGRKAMQEA